MKKVSSLLIIMILLINFISIKSSFAEGETLGDLLDKLNVLEEKYKKMNEEKKLTEEKLNEITNRMIEIGLNVNKTEDRIIEFQKEIENIKLDTEKKKIQIKNLASALQKNNGDENFYLEFLFGSEDLTEFIYRKQAIEQMVEYNNKTIELYAQRLDEIKEKELELNEEKKILEEESSKLSVEQEELGLQMNILDEDATDILEDIADARRTIYNYQKMGCGINDTLENCMTISADSSFLRPLTQGRITSGYGTRDNPLSSGYQFHPAVDIGGNPPGTSVYATASGVVVLAYNVPHPEISNSHCGGNHVIIQHKIGDTYYASRYMHLSKIYVSENQIVSANDIIGAVGGGESYDRCSTGPHLDFSIAKGIYGKDFYMFRQPYTVNPYTLVNLPEIGVYYTSRYERF